MNTINEFLFGLLSIAFVGVPFVLALLAGLLLPFALIATATLTSKVSDSVKLTGVFSVLILVQLAGVALSQRVLFSEADLSTNPFLAVGNEGAPLSRLISQIGSAFVMLISGAVILNWLLGKIRFKGAAAVLCGLMLMFFLCSVVVSGIAGVFREPKLNDLYVPILLAAVALLANGMNAKLWQWLRWPLLALSACSLAAMLIAPKLVLMPGFDSSLIPGFSQRLYGLTDHANSLGIFAAVALVLEFAPVVRSRPSWIVVAIQLLVLLLTQSKTAWIGAMVGIVFVRWFWMRQRFFSADKLQLTFFMLTSVCILMLTLALTVVFASDSPMVAKLLDKLGVFTLTGRAMIWQYTLNEFWASPLTGYGPSLWDMQFRIERGLMAVGQAHNQFVQTLGQAGLIGFIALLAYFGWMFYVAMRYSARDGSLALVLLFMLFIRCISESPMRMAGITGSDWIHFVAFAAVAGLAGRIVPKAAVFNPRTLYAGRAGAPGKPVGGA